MNYGDYKQRESLPMRAKIIKTARTIEDFYDKYEGDVYISTGGLDSTNLKYIADTYTEKKIECVCVGQCEGKENLKLNYKRGDTILKPSFVVRRGKKYLATKQWVISEYGYPLFTKETAMKVSRFKNTNSEEQKAKRLDGYIGKNGKKILCGKIPEYAKFLIYAPFDVSEKCCLYIKEKPLREYEKLTNKKPITGELATESNNRLKSYLKEGCIRTSSVVKCTPQAFWTKQDILKLAYEDKYEYSKAYGNITIKDDNILKLSGESRTGCENCLFGVQYDNDRLKRLASRDKGSYMYTILGGQWVRKNKYRYVIFKKGHIPIYTNLYWVANDKGLGYKKVIDYCNDFGANIIYKEEQQCSK